MDPLLIFEDEAKSTIQKAMNALGHDIRLPMELPSDDKGDYAFPCFSAAKTLKMAPGQIAEAVVKNIPKTELFDRIENVGPYVNFHIDQKKLANMVLASILKMRDNYGTFEPTGTRIILEHTSANPNNPLHVGRARNPIIGDTLARILRARGHDVEAEFYVDDMGKQQVTLTWGVENQEKLRSMLPDVKFETNYPDKPDHKMVGIYQAATTLMEKPEILAEIDKMAAEYEAGNPEVAEKIHDNCRIVLEGMIQSLRRLDVHYDSMVWESKFVIGEEASVKAVVSSLRKLDCTHEEGGALYLDLNEFGIEGRENKFYLTRSDGSTLYSTRDVAYHLDKLARGDKLINILGEDHKLKARVVNECLKLLGADRTAEIVFYSFVNLPEGKMSARRGQVVYLDDLMDEAVERAYAAVSEKRPELPEEIKCGIAEIVGVGAIRYNIIRVQAEKPITFKWSEALNFEGNSAPFIQYAHARCSSILRKSDAQKDYEPGLLKHPSEVMLIKALARFPSQVAKCADSKAIHQMTAYSFEIASLFNQFYRDCPVLQAGEALKNARLALVDATKTVLKNSLELLGITAPQEM